MDGGEADGLSGLMRCDSERAESSLTGSTTYNVVKVATKAVLVEVQLHIYAMVYWYNYI